MIKKINIEKLLLLFVIIQPFLDFYMLYSEQVTNIFVFSPSTILRIVFISFFTIYVLFKTKYNKKYFWILGYLVLVLIYLIFHILNALKFNISIGSHFNFSYKTELFYFIRMFIPIIFVYITYHLKITGQEFRKTIITVSLIFSLIIIITNILGIALTSYGGNHTISANIFSWFVKNDYTFEQLASKGLFYMANQISGVLVLLLPINLYYAVKTSKNISVLTSFLLSLSMIMLGTRVATYGWFLISLAVFIAWIFFSVIHKNKIGITKHKVLIYITLFLILLVITFYSPLVKRSSSSDFENLENENLSIEVENKFNDIKTDDETKNFIKDYSEKYSIPLVYIENLYPYINDSQFWIETMKLPYSKRGGNRNLEKLITKRVYELNNNNIDKYFGMGYSIFRNAKVYIEQDFIVHYYTLGIFGIILFLFPYFLIASFAIVYMLVKRKLRMRTTILCISVYLTLIISYFSGHILDELIITIILGFICGYILISIYNMEKHLKQKDICINDNPKVSIIVPVYNVEKYLDKCLNSLVNQTLKNIEIIVVNDGTKDNSQEIINKYVNKYSNVKSLIKENGGLSSARNYGLEYIKGDYIAFVDSDDWVELDMYEKLYYKAISNDFDMVVCDLKYVYENEKKYRIGYSNVSMDIFGKKDIKKSMTNIYPVAWNKLYKTSLFEKNIRFKLNVWYEDVEFMYRLYPYINSIGVVSKPLYNYLQRSGSITSVFDRRIYDYISNWNGIIKFYKKHKLFKEYSSELEFSYVRYMYATFIKGATKINDKKEYMNAVEEAIKQVNKNFPNYKNNKYLKKLSLKNIYLKKFNKHIAYLLFVFEQHKMN